MMSRFAQHTRLAAAPGKHDELVAKFLESAEIQRDNPDCELMLVSTAPDSADLAYLTEVWSSEDAWEQARRSAPIQAWAASISALISGPPESIPLEVMGGKGNLEQSIARPRLRVPGLRGWIESLAAQDQPGMTVELSQAGHTQLPAIHSVNTAGKPGTHDQQPCRLCAWDGVTGLSDCGADPPVMRAVDSTFDRR